MQSSILQRLESDPELNRLLHRIYEAGNTAVAEQGFNEYEGIVRETLNGIPLNNLWDEFQATLRIWGEDRDQLTNLLTYNVQNLTEKVFIPQEVDFEAASEFGVPKGIRLGKPTIMGYGFQWWDIAIRYTWMFLAESTDGQIRQLHNQALEADQRLMFSQVFRRIFNPTNDTALINDQNVNVYPLYNADGTVPPTYKGNSFNGAHTHYNTTGAATVVSADLDNMSAHLQHHGYEYTKGYELLLLVNPQEGATIRTFKVSSGAKYDFIPGPAFGGGVYIPMDKQVLVGAPRQAFGNVDQKIGTYGPFSVVEDYLIPAGYMLALVTAGPTNIGNLVGIREHANTGLRGLRLLAGAQHDYPLVDSYYQHGFGTGIRHRGGAVVSQVTVSGTYTTPAAYL